MIAAILPVRLAKELGALVPTWIVAVVVVGAGAVIGGGTLVAAGVVAFVIASVALGALSVGHEYTYGTLGVLLAQPVDRRRLFAIKVGVLAVLLILLTGPAWVLMSLHPGMLTFARSRRRARVPGWRLRHRFILLVAKELHIQQMTFVIAGLYALLALTAAWIGSMTPGATGTPLAALTVLHVGSVALLAGALASAEERQFGTLEWQVLLPMASSLQWAVKAGVAFGCALLLGAGLPAVLAQLHPGTTHALQNASVWPLVTATVLLTSCSLYVSSLSTSGVKALVLSLAAIFGVLLFAGMVRMTIWMLSPALLGHAASLVAAVFRSGDAMTGRLLVYAVTVASVGGLAAILLRFGMINHRSTRPGAAIIIRQLAVLVVLLTAGVFLLELVTVSRPRG